MSELLSSPAACCLPCPEPTTTAIPGPPGGTATPGAPGTNGQNAFTTLAASFVMPAFGATVATQVVSSAWAALGQTVVVGKIGSAAFAYMVVADIPDATHLTLRNPSDGSGAANVYNSNSAPATVFPLGSAVAPAGIQGIKGLDGTSGAPTNATYITQTPNGSLSAGVALSGIGATGLLHVTNGTGALAIKTLGIAANNIAPVDAGAALTAGQIVSAVAGGLKSDTAANQRTLLGLGTIAVQNANAVAITGGSILNTSISGLTGSFTTFIASGAAAFGAGVSFGGPVYLPTSTLQSLLAATAINPNAPTIRVVGNGGPVTLTATPTITTPATDGQLILIIGTDGTNTVTLQSEANLAGTKLKLAAATRVLAKNDILLLRYDQASGFWMEISFSDNEA